MKSRTGPGDRARSGAAVSALGALALLTAPLLSGCAEQTAGGAAPTVAQQRATACGGFGAGANKTDIGAAAGALLGGVAGYFAGGPQNRAVGVLAGAGLGGVLGGAIGSQLDAEDCARLTAQMQQSLQYSSDGGTTYFTSGNGNVHGQVVTSNTSYRYEEVAITRAPGVARPDDLVVVGRIRYAARETDLLSAPYAGATALGSVAEGEAIRVVGYPRPESSYDLVARNGIAVGYVRASALGYRAPAGAESSETLASVAPIRPKPELDSATGDESDVDHVQAKVECRQVTTTLSGSGSSGSSSSTACQTPDGAWNLSDYGAASG